MCFLSVILGTRPPKRVRVAEPPFTPLQEESPFQLRRIHMNLMNLRAGGIGGCGACLSNARVNRPCGIRRSSIFTMELTSYSSSLPMTNGGTKPT